MAGPDGNHYESYQNESETTTLLSPSPPSSPRRSKDHGSSPSAAQEDVRKHYKYALGTGYMFAMGVCGIVLVALGSTLDDLAENSESTATDVREKYIFGCFALLHDFCPPPFREFSRRRCWSRRCCTLSLFVVVVAPARGWWRLYASGRLRSPSQLEFRCSSANSPKGGVVFGGPCRKPAESAAHMSPQYLSVATFFVCGAQGWEWEASGRGTL